MSYKNIIVHKKKTYAIIQFNRAKEMNALSKEMRLEFNDALLDVERDDRLTWVEGLQETFEACYDQGVLPSELGTVSWAKSGDLIDLRDYREFPAFH
mgnify:CR=1 FL=1